MKQIYVLKEPENKISQASDLFDNIKKINVDYKQENFILLCLNTKNQIIYSEIIFKGGLDACFIDPKTIFRIALKHNSSRIIIGHNHPSGDLKPSTEDYDVFTRLKNCGEILSLKCLDSIIFNRKEYYTMK